MPETEPPTADWYIVLSRWQGQVDQKLKTLYDMNQAIQATQKEILEMQTENKQQLDKLESCMDNHLHHHEKVEMGYRNRDIWVRWIIPVGLSIINLVLYVVQNGI